MHGRHQARYNPGAGYGLTPPIYNICVAERPERGHEDKKTDKTKKPRNKVLKDFIPRPLSF